MFCITHTPILTCSRKPHMSHFEDGFKWTRKLNFFGLGLFLCPQFLFLVTRSSSWLDMLSHSSCCHLPPSLTLLSPSLPQDPKERLGCHPQTGFADINSHPFFRNVDWELVSNYLFFFFFVWVLLLFILSQSWLLLK